MKTIVLHISDQVFTEMKSSMGCRMISGGAYGILDGIIAKIIASVMNKEKEITLQYKSEVDDGGTDKG